MDFLRTPEERFAALPGFSYPPKYVQLGDLRMAYIDEGDAAAPPVLMLHGERTGLLARTTHRRRSPIARLGNDWGSGTNPF